MSENIGELYVEVKAKSDKLEKELSKIRVHAEKQAKGIGDSFNNLFLLLGGAAMVRGFFQFATYTKNLARDAEEIRSKFNQVFSSIQDEANTAADQFAKSFGLAKTSARDFLAETGDLLVGFQFSEKEALNLSVRVNALAQDLVSFKNYTGGAKGASLALTKALLGETESAKSLGIVIRQDSKEFESMVNQLMVNKGYTEKQAKALVILDEAYKQSAKGVGDYERTKKSLANTERTYQEQLKELNEEIGVHSATVFATLINFVSELGKNMGSSQGAVSLFGVAMKSLASVIIPIITLVKMLGTYIGTFWAAVATAATLDFTGAFNVIKKGFGMIGDDAKTMADNLWNLWETAGKPPDQTDKSIEQMQTLKQKIDNTTASLKHMEEHGFKGNDIYKRMEENLKSLKAQYKDIEGNQDATWSKEGKTLGQMGERVEFLKKKLNTLTENSPDFSKTKEQLLDLETHIKKITSGEGVKFISQIPEGKNEKQFAEFQKLRFAVAGYADFRMAQIELAYKTEVANAKGNTQQILAAEENKKLAIADLEQEILDDKIKKHNAEIDDYNRMIGEIDGANKDAQEKVKKQESDYNQQRFQAIDDYYSGMIELDENYFAWKLDKVRTQRDALLQATGDPVIAKQYELDNIKALEEEYFQWKVEKLTDHLTLTGDLFSVSLASINSAYDTFWQSLANTDMTGAERIKTIWEGVKQAALSTLGDIIKGYIQSWVQSQVIGNTFKTAELATGVALGSSLAAAYAPAAAFASIMSFGGAAVAGSAGLASTVALAEALAIPKFAKGGDFIVPAGYPNDSYPLLVESGERVQVTPKGQSGNDNYMLLTINNSIRALTKTLYEKKTAPIINANIDGLTFTEKTVNPNQKRLQRLGKETDEL